ncbi:MAG: hypothetical protein NTW87_17875 [Planctomycetota bacterium]|nr:hypothetical protein [Planctomycetota bacterium]
MASESRLTPKNVIIVAFVLLTVGAGGAGMYLAEKHFYGPLREQKRLVENLKLVVTQLTRDIRIADVAVLEQTGNPLTTTIKFVEVDEQHKAIGPVRKFTFSGDEVYFDSLVIKFEEPFKPLNELPLKQQDLAPTLMNKAIIFFRRAFSDKQKPEDGFPLDTPGCAPEPYRHKGPPSAFEQQLWQQFWDLANDPKLAKEHGVRAAHGQAVSMKLRKDKYYVIEQRVTGDMTIRPVDVPDVLKN